MSTLLRTEDDAAIEAHVARLISEKWNCEVHSFGKKDHLDYYAIRNGETVAYMELKARKVSSTTYPTIYLAIRKWHSLITMWLGTGIRCFFIVKFTDALMWIDITEVDTARRSIGGNSRGLRKNDIEPMIEIPISDMKLVTRS